MGDTLLPANILPASITDLPSQIFVLVFLVVFVGMGVLVTVGVVKGVEWLRK